jgi:mono/diheme cytochrome c family protein
MIPPSSPVFERGFAMDEVQEDYKKYLQIGLGLTILVVLGLAYYSFSEQARLTHAADDFIKERVVRGERIFADQCVACHGAEGEGGTGPALKSRQLLKTTQDNVFFSIIRSGVPNTQMPAWSVDYGGPLTDEDVRDIVALMRSWEPTAEEILLAPYIPDPQNGAQLFANTCAICHGDEGSGTDKAPKINDPQRLALLQDEWYRDVIRNGRPAKGMPTWGTVLSPEQVEDIVALIDAWREGVSVQPDFLITDLIDRAVFFLDNGDIQSAALQIEHALSIAEGVGADMLASVQDQLSKGDAGAAMSTLQNLQASWPLGDPAGGAIAYTTSCSPCHGIQGEGGIGRALNSSEFIQTQSNAQLYDLIAQGRSGTSMVGFADRLSEADIANIIAFLRLWQR